MNGISTFTLPMLRDDLTAIGTFAKEHGYPSTKAFILKAIAEKMEREGSDNDSNSLQKQEKE